MIFNENIICKREILFKAISKETGEWVEGDLFREQDIFGNIDTYIHQIKGNGLWRKHIVDDETVCQYTGRTDDDGNKIWEHDILLTSKNNTHWLVYYDSTSFCAYQKEGDFIYSLNELFHTPYTGKITVVGNAFVS